MSERRPYSRVYWSILDDLKFERVRDDDAAYAEWNRLLMVADMAYPAPASLPSTDHLERPARRARLAARELLVEVGLVDLLTGGRYRLHGLQAERERRASAATRDHRPDPPGPQPGPNRDPDGTQQGPNRDPDGFQAKPSQAETETSTAEAARRAGDTDDPADAYWSLTGRYPAHKLIRWIDDLSEQYGQEPTTRALVQAHVADQSPATLLGRTKDILAAGARALDRLEQAEERERLRQKRAVPRELPSWEQEYRRMIGERYGAA